MKLDSRIVSNNDSEILKSNTYDISKHNKHSYRSVILESASSQVFFSRGEWLSKNFKAFQI